MSVEKAANRLHHLSMLYVGAMAELLKGGPVATLPHNYPGLKDCRDLIDQVLFCRAEVNALTKLLLDAKLITPQQAEAAFAENYEWFAQQKITRWPGWKIEDYGLAVNTKAATAPPEETN